MADCRLCVVLLTRSDLEQSVRLCLRATAYLIMKG